MLILATADTTLSNCTTGEIRLAGEISPAGDSGRLELCQNKAWGTVCGRFFGSQEAEVACRQLGFKPTYGKFLFNSLVHLLIVNFVGLTVRASSEEYAGIGSGPLYNFNCSYSDLFIKDCKLNRGRCNHFSDVTVKCIGKNMYILLVHNNIVTIIIVHWFQLHALTGMSSCLALLLPELE